MARREILMDDLDQSEEGVRTVRFGFDGINYEIDLGPANVEKLASALAPYMGKARRESGRAAGTVKPRSMTAAEQRKFNQGVREWAKSQGRKVNERGRVPAKLIEEFLAAGR